MPKQSSLPALPVLLLCGLALFVVVVPGCGALSTATSGVSTGVSTGQQAGSTGDQVKGLGGQAKDLVTGKKKDGPDAEGPGDDDDRLRAKEAQINTPLNDKVDNKKGDKEDWRQFHLQGKPGVATFELFWDNEASNIDIDVYDAYGVNVGRSPPRMEGQSKKSILVQVKPGLYYVRIKAPTEKDKSIYTLNVKWEGPQFVAKADPTPPPPDAGVPPGPGPGPGPGVVVPVSPLNDPNKLLGNVISAYRDGNGWVLYIDKGTSSKLRQGMTGGMLEGPDGDKYLDKGDFTISQVVDGTKSIARTNLNKPPGKNKRCLINLR